MPVPELHSPVAEMMPVPEMPGCLRYLRQGLAMKKKKTLALLLVITSALSGCGDECRQYSDFSCKEIEKAPYNVYFYHPSGIEQYLGQSQGLSQCGNVAYGFASSKNLSGNGEWSYICCMRAKGSECYEKHR
jgi:hypothetical protein